MADTLFDAMQEAASPDETPERDEAAFAGDTQYHIQAYVIEQALRDAGVLPDPGGAREPRPYDDDLKRLIQAVPVE